MNFCFWKNTNAQDLNRKDLISQLKANATTLFVINGIPNSYFDSSKSDITLNKIENNKIVRLTILKNDGIVDL